MKLNIIWIAVAGLALAFTGCKNSDEVDEHHYDNKLFLSTSELTQEVKFMSNDNSIVEKTLGVSLAKPEAFDINVKIVPAPEMLDIYRVAYYDAEAEILPKECYTMSATETTISAGGMSSPELPIKFSNLGMLDAKKTYVLPVTIKTTEGIGVLRSGNTLYYVFRAASLVNVVCNIKENRAYPDFNGDAKFNRMSQNTLEILFKANGFPNTLNTLMGIEDHYLLRLGDAGIPSNQLQISSSQNITSSDLQFEINKWYHLAVTFNAGSVKIYVNGQEKASGKAGISTVSFDTKHTDDESAGRCFWIGYSYRNDRFFDGVVSEVRIWNRSLSAEEIQAENHFYMVDPNSEGLIAYWKFNEGAGQIVKDYSPSGYDLTIEKSPVWIPVSLPEK